MKSLIYFIIANLLGKNEFYVGANINKDLELICPFYKDGQSLHVPDLVGSWMTVYTRPSSVSCFILHVRATTDLERESCQDRYGNFSGQVDWSKCLLEVNSPIGKHYLQGDGSKSGMLENVIVTISKTGEYMLYDQVADQWAIFGQRGNEVLLMRDCLGETVALFARAPYWPEPSDLYAVLHRSDITSVSMEKILCEPVDFVEQSKLKNFFIFRP